MIDGGAMDFVIGAGELVGRLLLAIAYGAFLGWEREAQHKPAGLRTHMMVSLGAAAFTLVSLELYRAASHDGMRAGSDPIRIVEGVTAGIGFLGAGSIIQSGGSVQGITTAAGMWVVGAIGIACGGGHYLLATLTTALAFVILAILGAIEARFRRTQA